MGMFEGVMGSWFLRLGNVKMAQAIFDLCGVPLDARYTVRAVSMFLSTETRKWSRIYLCTAFESCDSPVHVFRGNWWYPYLNLDIRPPYTCEPWRQFLFNYMINTVPCCSMLFRVVPCDLRCWRFWARSREGRSLRQRQAYRTMKYTKFNIGQIYLSRNALISVFLSKSVF